MNNITRYSKKKSNNNIILDISDICLELRDIGFITNVNNIQDYTSTSYCIVSIHRYPLFSGSDISV